MSHEKFSLAPPMTIVVECKWMLLIDEDNLAVNVLHDNLKHLLTTEVQGLYYTTLKWSHVFT